MEYLPLSTSILFILTSGAAVWLFFRAANKSLNTLFVLLAWMLIQAILSINGFYQETRVSPPRTSLFIFPPVLLILVLLLTVRGKAYTDQLNPAILTMIHILRIPVECVLYGLLLEKKVPQLMTFAGGNYDILSGLSAPCMYYLAFVKKLIGRKTMLTWNFICLCLLLSVVIHALLSVPSPFQQFAFEQPNIAILQFPYAWLPSFIVPMVFYAHLASIRYWLRKTADPGLNSGQMASAV